jgi:Protein of unknown function (DUF3489)
MTAVRDPINTSVQTTGWQRHSVRGFLAGVVRRRWTKTIAGGEPRSRAMRTRTKDPDSFIDGGM